MFASPPKRCKVKEEDDLNTEALRHGYYREKNAHLHMVLSGTFSGFCTDADRRDFTIDFISSDIHCIHTSGGSRISERGGQSTPLGWSGGMLPQKFFFISGLLRSYLVHSG